jgi:PAS domain S-box-containing protein
VGASLESQAAAFSRSPVPCVVYGTDSAPRAANKAYRDLIGIEPQSRDLALWERMHPQDRDAVAGAWNEAGGHIALMGPIELRIIDAAGEWRWVMCIPAELPDTGEVTVTLIDITKRKGLEKRLADNARYTEALLNQSADIITVMDPDGKWRSSSPQGTAILGHPRGYDPPGGVFDLIHPDDRAQAMEAFAELVGSDDDKKVTVELRLATADGDYRRFDAVGVNLTADPTVAGVVISARDVTDRYEAREAQARSDERWRNLVESLNDGLWVIDSEAVTTFVNPHMAEMLGVSAEEMVGSHLFDWMSAEMGDLAEQYLSRRSVGMSEVHEFTFLRADGTELAAVVSVAPRMRDGELVESVAVITDVSKLKATEAELDAAVRAARQASEAKTVFLSHVSHELRTPLNSILGFAWLLRESTDPTAAEYATRIEQAGGHLTELIKELIDVTRLESGQMELSVEPVQLNEAVAEAATLAGIAPGRLRTVLDGDAVLADRSRLVQVLVNLIANADRYGPAAGAITVSSVAGPDTTVISVADEGDGIPSDNVDRIFEPFVRLNAGNPGTQPGTGLGLAISRGLAEAMGGSLALRSGPPTTFDVTLCTAEPHARSDGAAEQRAVIVAVEDDELSRQMLRMFFDTRRGVTLFTAATLREGMDLIAAHRPDVVLLDMHLPDGSGLDVLDVLRDSPNTADLPVVVVTADAGPALRRQALAAGADGYVVKPYRLPDIEAELLDRVRMA